MSLSRLVLGTAQIGIVYGIANKEGQPNQKQATAIIHEAWESGIREFDTAQAYGDSEAFLGKALSDLGISRHAKIITKLHPKLNHLDLSAMSRALDASLSRLHSSSIYGIMVHDENLFSLWKEGLSEILTEFVSIGKVRYVGVSVYSPLKAIAALSAAGVDFIQVPYNILDRRFEKAGVFQLANEKKKHVYVRSVYLQGLLLMPSTDVPEKMAFAKPVLDRVEFLSETYGLSRREIALAFVRQELPEAKTIIGADNPKQVRENIEDWIKEIPEDLISNIRNCFVEIEERLLNPSLWPDWRRLS